MKTVEIHLPQSPLGAELTIDPANGEFLIASVLSNSMAEVHGLARGHQLTKVNGALVTGKSMAELGALVTAGGRATLTFLCHSYIALSDKKESVPLKSGEELLVPLKSGEELLRAVAESFRAVTVDPALPAEHLQAWARIQAWEAHQRRVVATGGEPSVVLPSRTTLRNGPLNALFLAYPAHHVQFALGSLRGNRFANFLRAAIPRLAMGLVTLKRLFYYMLRDFFGPNGYEQMNATVLDIQVFLGLSAELFIGAAPHAVVAAPEFSVSYQPIAADVQRVDWHLRAIQPFVTGSLVVSSRIEVVLVLEGHAIASLVTEKRFFATYPHVVVLCTRGIPGSLARKFLAELTGGSPHIRVVLCLDYAPSAVTIFAALSTGSPRAALLRTLAPTRDLCSPVLWPESFCRYFEALVAELKRPGNEDTLDCVCTPLTVHHKELLSSAIRRLDAVIASGTRTGATGAAADSRASRDADKEIRQLQVQKRCVKAMLEGGYAVDVERVVQMEGPLQPMRPEYIMELIECHIPRAVVLTTAQRAERRDQASAECGEMIRQIRAEASAMAKRVAADTTTWVRAHCD